MPLLPIELVAEAMNKISEIPCGGYGHDDACVLIDVREPAEFQNGTIPGAVNMPRGVLEFMIHTHPGLQCESHPVKEKADSYIVLFCQSGGRSALAAASLQSMGFTNVKSMAEGWFSLGEIPRPKCFQLL